MRGMMRRIFQVKGSLLRAILLYVAGAAMIGVSYIVVETGRCFVNINAPVAVIIVLPFAAACCAMTIWGIAEAWKSSGKGWLRRSSRIAVVALGVVVVIRVTYWAGLLLLLAAVFSGPGIG